ncbi:MAG: hypothetical protein H0U70_11885 [Tatlockia sp.]|nr:hypothetical protein [Tatlockia sp.]
MIRDWKYLALYLVITFTISWGIILGYVVNQPFMVATLGEFTQTSLAGILVLYMPSIAGLLTYYFANKESALRGVLAKLVPNKKDLIWFPILFLIMVFFAFTNHFVSLLFGVPVPEITLSYAEMGRKILTLFVEETGLIGGVFGWTAFLLPFLQTKFQSNIKGAVLTGLIFGIWVMPAYLLSPIAMNSSYLLYVLQLMTFFTFISFIYNKTNGCLAFYLFAFWLAAAGSHIQLYYFNTQVQFIQIVFFTVGTLILKVLFNKNKTHVDMQDFRVIANLVEN